MNATRREFLKKTIVGGAAAGIGLNLNGPAFAEQPAAGTSTPAGGKLKLLILGGTAFLGPHTVRYALSRGHTMSLFNRGKTNPDFFPELEKLRGDRKDDLKSLEGRQWDAVIDTSGYVPRHVKMSADLLAPNVKQYVFISTISVYGDVRKPNADETTPVAKIEDETVEKVDGRTYGPLKALCEQAAETAMPGRVTNIRPGLIVGPEDPSDRFTYWPARIDRGGEVLAPGDGSDFIQVIDVRDLAEFIVHALENKVMGVYNADGPPATLTMGHLVDSCKSASKSDARIMWVPTEFLESKSVEPWGDMPVWIPPKGDYAGAGRLNVSKSISKGMKFRPTADTVRDTLAWFRTLPEERRSKLKAGISPEREKEVLEAWHKSTGK